MKTLMLSPAYEVGINHTFSSMAELRARSRNFCSADQVRKLTVFNIVGNKYRLITYIDYQTKKYLFVTY